jgi:hypothetical protein
MPSWAARAAVRGAEPSLERSGPPCHSATHSVDKIAGLIADDQRTASSNRLIRV